MNKKELIDALESLGMRPGRGLGQNFLLDGNLLEWIIRNCGAKSGDTVLEVGPGFGALTEKMVAAGFQVTAIEFDHRLAEYLRKKFAGKENFKLIEADACKVDYDELFPKGVYHSVANLPYAISSVFIAKLLEAKNSPESMFFMLQKEMGERLAARPGTKAYGALSLRTQLHYTVTIEKTVPPQVFSPPPEVDSALVSFKKNHDTRPVPAVEKLFTALVRNLFNQRRKQMGKTLGNIIGNRPLAEETLQKYGFSPEIRPDKLTVQDFLQLAESFYAAGITDIRG